MNNLKLYALGGLDENGKNLYCVEIDEAIYIVNCGIKRTDISQFGIDYVTCDITYLVENRDRVKAVIVTNMHDDMMEAVPFLLKEISVPVYATPICLRFLREYLKESNVTKYALHELPRSGETVIEGVRVTSFGLTSSTPEAIGIAIDTPKGQVVFASEYVTYFDLTSDYFRTDIGKVAEIGKQGVLVAMIESMYADRPGFTSPNHCISGHLRPVFEDAQGRIIITVYGQNYFRIKEIFDLAAEFHKKIYCRDAKFRSYLNVFAENDYYVPPKDTLLTPGAFRNEIDDCIILVTGFGARVFNGMYRIAIGEDEEIELRGSDTVIIASPAVSGAEKEASAMENELYRDNVHVVKLDKKQVLSMHPSQEDIKMFLSLLKPSYFLPVAGSYRDFVNAANLAVEIGFTPDKIIILDNGQIAEFEDGRLKSTASVIENIGENLINEEEKKDITSSVLKDRELLSTDGVIIIGIAIDYNTKHVIAGPDIQSRGVIYVKDSEYLIKNLANMCVDMIEEKATNGEFVNLEARAEMREMVAKYVFRETGKKPMILPAIIEINI
ncbi:MAG: ribonuclease J [Erysipelotrichaceae bacterium]|nr:ribonuclease J [Erysipelotrichaceae bacterium]MBO4538117.1 ribonuclease J [Erysipelotrichaceae bacterium]MBR5048468.1 ribonuclease J [Erysipelotrichaceae bacterium]